MFNSDKFVNVGNVTLNLIVLALYNICFKNDLINLGEYITVTIIHCLMLSLGLYCSYHQFKRKNNQGLDNQGLDNQGLDNQGLKGSFENKQGHNSKPITEKQYIKPTNWK